MDHLEPELNAAIDAWDRLDWPRPDAFVVSGSGLSTDLGTRLVEPRPWSALLPFQARGIEGHPLEIVLVEPTPGRVVLHSRGRLHAYQGFTSAQVVFPVRLAALLGARVLILTNSSGGLRSEHRAGDLILIRDHLNLTGMNPLSGRFPESWGPQFPDMSSAYEPALRELIRGAAGELGIELEEGVYAGLAGPSYETPAEVRMLRTLGADAVGMSTVLEVIAGRHMGMRCAGLSLVSNPAAGVTDEVLDHADVLARGAEVAADVARLLERVLADPGLLG
jgi:purine-nucleoside phosphorylase